MNGYILALKVLSPEYISLFTAVCISLVVWRLLGARHDGKLWWRRVNLALSALAVIFILWFSVLGREGSGVHRFIWFADSEPWELISELYRNLFLYFPLGLFLPYAMGGGAWPRKRWACVALGLLLSVGIEIWQYACGTGVAQFSDAMMNTLGTMTGAFAHPAAGTSRTDGPSPAEERGAAHDAGADV